MNVRLPVLLFSVFLGACLRAATAEAERCDQLNTLRAVMLEHEKHAIVKAIFEERFFLSNNSKNVITQDTIEELDLIDLEQKKGSLSAALGSVQTVFGQKAKNEIIKNPTTDREVLEKRKNVIAALKEDRAAAQNLKELFKQLKDNESAFLSFWKPEDELIQKTLQEIYYGKRLESLNSQAMALEALRYINHLYQGLGFVPPALYWQMISAALEYGSKKIIASNWDKLNSIDKKDFIRSGLFKPTEMKQSSDGTDKRPVLPSIADFCTTLPVEAVESYFPKWAAAHTPLLKNPFNDRDYTLGAEIKNFANAKTSIRVHLGISWFMRFGHDAWWLYRSKSAYAALAFKENIAGLVHKKIHQVACFFNTLKKITFLCSAHQELNKNFTQLAALRQLCYKPSTLSRSMQQLIALLSTPTLKSEPSYFSLRGRALAAYKLMQQVRDQFGEALQAVGELEAYISVADMMNTKTACFTRFISQDRPYLSAVGLYNPLIPNTSSAQDIALGARAGVPNMLITGPNGCGKSAAMKSLVYSILGGLTFCVSFAECFEMTPFDKVITYFAVKDDLAQGRSTFMAEINRVDSIERQLEQLENNKHAIVFVDEGLKGTIEEEGAHLLYSFYEKISNLPASMFIGATHFEQPTNLEVDTQGRVINYHVELIQHRNGGFTRTFKLMRGKNEWWFNDAKKRGQFIEWLKETECLAETKKR